jgi:hypothetical protein
MPAKLVNQAIAVIPGGRPAGLGILQEQRYPPGGPRGGAP